jgi:hypothetical protein
VLLLKIEELLCFARSGGYCMKEVCGSCNMESASFLLVSNLILI